LPDILKIADNLKNDVEDFAPQVPVVMALRTEGIKDRHWTKLSESLGQPIKPYEGFTFQKCMDMKLLEYTE